MALSLSLSLSLSLTSSQCAQRLGSGEWKSHAGRGDRTSGSKAVLEWGLVSLQCIIMTLSSQASTCRQSESQCVQSASAWRQDATKLHTLRLKEGASRMRSETRFRGRGAADLVQRYSHGHSVWRRRQHCVGEVPTTILSGKRPPDVTVHTGEKCGWDLDGRKSGDARPGAQCSANLRHPNLNRLCGAQAVLARIPAMRALRPRFMARSMGKRARRA